MKICEACGETAYGGGRLCHACSNGTAPDMSFEDEVPTALVDDDDELAWTLDEGAGDEGAGHDGALPVMSPTAADLDGLEVKIEPRYEFGSAPGDAEPVVNVLVTLAPSGAPLTLDRSGPVAHVILALDVSASMNHADKYPILTQALEGMLLALQAPEAGEILLSVVAFAYGSEILFREVSARSLSPRDVIDALDRSPLRFGKYTDIVGALSRAGRIAYDSDRADKELPIRICLMTDGKPQDQEGALEIMEKVGKIAVDVDAFAFGSDADVPMLQRLVCGNRGGTVKHVRKDTLTEAYGRIAEVAQKVVAKRALFKVELGPSVVGGAAYRFRPGRHCYGRNAFVRGQVFETDLGTLEDGRKYSLLLAVRLPQDVMPDTEIGKISLRVPGWGAPREYGATLAIPRHRGTATLEPDPLVVEARSVLDALDSGDAQAMLEALRTRRKIYVSEHRDPYLLEVIDKAISELEEVGTLDALSRSERASLTAHTATAGSRAAPLGSTH